MDFSAVTLPVRRIDMVHSMATSPYSRCRFFRLRSPTEKWSGSRSTGRQLPTLSSARAEYQRNSSRPNRCLPPFTLQSKRPLPKKALFNKHVISPPPFVHPLQRSCQSLTVDAEFGDILPK